MQYIGPYSAEYYDNLYGKETLFSAPQTQPQSIMQKIDPTGWLRMDIAALILIVLILSFVSYTLIKNYK
jgi:hypothetical protein